jgi:hypothetical protein
VKRRATAPKKVKKRRTRFVPPVVFGTLCIGVVPVFAASCASNGQPGGGGDGGDDHVLLGVCNCGFDAYGVFVGFDTGAGKPDAEAGADATPADGATEATSEAGDGGAD